MHLVSLGVSVLTLKLLSPCVQFNSIIWAIFYATIWAIFLPFFALAVYITLEAVHTGILFNLTLGRCLGRFFNPIDLPPRSASEISAWPSAGPRSTGCPPSPPPARSSWPTFSPETGCGTGRQCNGIQNHLGSLLGHFLGDFFWVILDPF